MVEKYVETREVMGTFATVTLISTNGSRAVAAMDSAFAALDSVAAWMNPRDPESFVHAVNAASGGDAVTVNAATYHVLFEASRITRLTEGTFDASVGPLLDLWRRCAAADRLPLAEELRRVLRSIGMSDVILDGEARSVRLRAPGMRLDLGGIAKGFAIDLAVEAIKRTGISQGIVEVGGDLRCFGQIPAALIGVTARLPVRALRERARPTGNDTPEVFSGIRRTAAQPSGDRRHWPLGVQNPFGEGVLGKIRLGQGAVATSGHYRRYMEIGGQRFSHIVDPRTGWPVSAPASVTVIAARALLADALATAIAVLGAGSGLALAESLQAVEALVIEGSASDPVLRYTTNFPRLEALASTPAEGDQHGP